MDGRSRNPNPRVRYGSGFWISSDANHNDPRPDAMKEQFKDFSFKPETLALISKCNAIIATLRAQGYMLTLRQLYYQLVSKDIIANKQTEYKRLGSVLNDARLVGLTDWSAIEDRTRNLESVNHWDSPEEIIRAVGEQYRIDKWEGQANYVEVWVEKDALVGVLEKACRALDVAWFSCRGYTSQSELYVAGKRLAEKEADGRTPIIIHLGDHDPSGIDMTRDITDRVRMLGRLDSLEVRRIALNMDQIEHYNPPPNPAKVTDSRYEGYSAIHGEESWELDALDPQVIDQLISDEVENLRDPERYEEMEEREERERAQLKHCALEWDSVVRHLRRIKE
jgi:hypothetical protein